MATELDHLRAELGRLRAENERLRSAPGWPPGHYYSPLPSPEALRTREQAIWGEPPRRLPAIDLNEDGQLALLGQLAGYYRDLPFGDQPQPGLRYHFANPMFGYADAVVLYCLIRHLKPKRVIEVGSGYSSAVMLDTNDLFFGGRIALTFIEPHPDRLLSLLHEGDADRARIIRTPVQDVDPDLFGELAADYILFIDSSHVAKV